MMGSFEKVRLAAARMGHTMLELAEWNAGSDPEHDRGERLIRLERYAEAGACFLKLASDLKSRSGARGRYVRALLALAQCQRKQGQLSDARQSAETAREVLVTRTKPCSELATCIDLLGSLHEDDGNLDEARKSFREAIDVEEKIVPLDPTALTQRYRRLTKALSDTDESETRTILNRAVELAEKRLGTQSPITAECLMELGQFQMSKGEKDAGIASMERAVDIHRHTHGSISEEVTRDLECLASACHMAGDLEKAVNYYERAVNMRERQVGGSAADLAVLFMALADAHSLLGNDAPAMELFQQAVGKLTGSNDGHLAWALEGLGVSYSRSGRFDDAISCYRKARVLWEKVPGANQEMLDANALHLEEAMSYAPAGTVAGPPPSLFSKWSFRGQNAAPEGVDAGAQPSATTRVRAPRPRRPAVRDPNTVESIECASVIPSGPRLAHDRIGALGADDTFSPAVELVNAVTDAFAPPALKVVCMNPEAVPEMNGPVTAILMPTRSVPSAPQGVEVTHHIHSVPATEYPNSGAHAVGHEKTLQLVVVAPDNNLGLAPYPVVADKTAAERKLSGWDELAFDLLPASAPPPNRAA